MRNCKDCGEEKSLDQFYMNQGRPRRSCKTCFNRKNTKSVAEWRRRAKKVLIEEHGGRCLDCGFQGPPFMFDFDHRDPSQKSFEINMGGIKSLDSAREEAEKCDLVCANCHRMRTHKQRCDGCEYCSECSQGDKAASS